MDRIAAAARWLLAEHDRAAPYRALPADLRPADLSQAYAVQDAFQDLLRDAGAGRLAGHKIALTAKVMQAMTGVDHPCAGGVFETRVWPTPAALRAADFGHVGVECEVAVRLVRPLPVGDRAVTATDVAAAVDAVAAAFELAEDRHADYADLEAMTLIADNTWNGGVVLGPWVTDWPDRDLVAAAGALTLNGREVSRGRGGDAMGHPFRAVAWIANHLAGRGREIGPGQFVMTGSIVRTEFLSAGDHAGFRHDALGEVELRLD